jgi:beta-galactosidase
MIAGIGSADLTTTESYQANPRRVYQGRAMVIIRSTGESGRIVLRAKAPGLKSGRTVVRAR